MADRENRPDIEAYGQSFRARKDSEGRKGYALFDDNPRSDPRTRWQEIAVIYPLDASRSVHSENNASLSLRDPGTPIWQSRGTHSLDESLRRAAQHADRHYEKYGPADARFDEYALARTLEIAGLSPPIELPRARVKALPKTSPTRPWKDAFLTA